MENHITSFYPRTHNKPKVRAKTGDNPINDRIEVLRGNIKKDLIELMKLQGMGTTLKFKLELIPEKEKDK